MAETVIRSTQDDDAERDLVTLTPLIVEGDPYVVIDIDEPLDLATVDKLAAALSKVAADMRAPLTA